MLLLPALRARPALPRLAAALCALTLSLPALAGRPLQTEDAGVLDRGDCELEGVFERVRFDGSTARERHLSANCGIGLQTQVGLAGGWLRADGRRDLSAGIGGKTRLWTGESEGAPAFTLAWGVAGDRLDGGWRRSGHFLTAVASVGAGPARCTSTSATPTSATRAAIRRPGTWPGNTRASRSAASRWRRWPRSSATTTATSGGTWQHG